VAGLYAGAALASPYYYDYGYPDAGYAYPYAGYSGYAYPSAYPAQAAAPYGYPAQAAPSGYPSQAMTYAPAAPATSYWYYCQNPAGYYPYVQQCPTQWQPVPAG
jgi:hypothetical protein